jgi:hypothetical protein
MGDVDGPEPDPRAHFRALDREAQIATIRKLSAEGFGDYELASASGWAVEFVRLVIGARDARTP